MKKIFHKIYLGLLVCSIGQAYSAETRPSSDRPNFLIIMADDMGYGDLSLHGGKTPTPHLDKLFQSGMVMENFMVTPLCSPTRASLLTGCNPLRINQGPYVDGVLSPSRTTFGSAFQQEGYVTGIFGKWHNSVAPMFDASMPDINDFGFDEWVGGYGGGFDFFTKIWPNDNSTPCWYHNREPVSDDREYATDSLTDHSIRFMKENRNKSFVCYLPHLAMHDPFHAKMEDLKKVPQELVDEAGGLRSWKEYYKLYNDVCFGGRLQEGYVKLTGDHSLESIAGTLSLADKKVLYSAMLINLDENVGRLLAYLKESGLEKNTVVWFFSDNGGAQFPWANNNEPLRGCKATIWEGGIHSRAVVRWPAAGWDVRKTFDGLMGSQDVYPTCMAMAGLSVPNAEEIDGKPCFSAMQNNAPSPVEAYYYLWEGADVIRTERWKLIRYWKHSELYDLKTDLNETTDVAGKYPEKVQELMKKLDAWMTENGITAGHLPQQATQHTAEQAHPSPLEVKFTQTGPCRKMVRIRGLRPVRLQTGDQLEYDILFHEASKVNGGHLSMNRSTGRPLFLNQSVDQFGQLFSPSYSYEDARGNWAHRVVGVGHGCPEVASVLGFQLTGEGPGSYHFYLDNIMIRRRDGSTEMIWQKGMPLSGASAPQGVSGLQVMGEIK